MPNRKKFNARFPPARIKKIMRTDKEVGKVAAPVPAVISRALELFAEQLLQKAGDVTLARGSRTLSPAHLKHCILSERRFDFLKELVEGIPDAAESEEAGSSSSALSAPPTLTPTATPASAASTRSAELSSLAATSPESAVSEVSGVRSAPRSVGRPPKYLKMDIPATAVPSVNGQPHSAPPGRPPVPGLIHTSVLGLTGGAVTASAVGGERFTFGGPLVVPPELYSATPPPAHRGPARPPPLAVRYGSLPDGERPEGV